MINIGKIINNTNDGAIIHNIPLANAFTLFKSPVSIYSQIIDSTDTRGIDAMILPKILSLFAISETSAIIPEEINILIRYLKIKDISSI